MIRAEYAHKLADDSQKNFYNDIIKQLDIIITRQCRVGGYKVKYPISFKISTYFGDDETNEISENQRTARVKDVENIIQFLKDIGYTVSFDRSVGVKEIPIESEDVDGRTFVSDHITETTYLYELIISW